jgi:hypothetical protein
MPGEVDDHGLVDGLAADAGRGAARQHRHVMTPAHLQRGQHVVGAHRLHDPDRDVPVVGGVGREHAAAGRVEPDFALDFLGQVSR